MSQRRSMRRHRAHCPLTPLHLLHMTLRHLVPTLLLAFRLPHRARSGDVVTTTSTPNCHTKGTPFCICCAGSGSSACRLPTPSRSILTSLEGARVCEYRHSASAHDVRSNRLALTLARTLYSSPLILLALSPHTPRSAPVGTSRKHTASRTRAC